MLHLSGNTAGDVELGTDRLPRLADLVCVGDPSGIDGRPARTDSATQRAGEFLEEGEVFRRAHAAPAGDEDIHLGDIHGLDHFLQHLNDAGAGDNLVSPVAADDDFPLPSRIGKAGLKTLGRTVDIWGRRLGQAMVAMMFPP